MHNESAILNPVKISDQIHCNVFPCRDVQCKNYIVPHIEVEPKKIRMIMISEASSSHGYENFYHTDNQEYMQATVQIFNDAGLNISNINETIAQGIYITTAIKCPKEGLSISTETIKNCSHILENELAIFKNIKVVMLNGDVAIRAVNYIKKRQEGIRVIPAGSTYKIRNEKYIHDNIRYLPSYILTGKNLLIEKSKRRMITEDIQEALHIIHTEG